MIAVHLILLPGRSQEEHTHHSLPIRAMLRRGKKIKIRSMTMILTMMMMSTKMKMTSNGVNENDKYQVWDLQDGAQTSKMVHSAPRLRILWALSSTEPAGMMICLLTSCWKSKLSTWSSSSRSSPTWPSSHHSHNSPPPRHHHLSLASKELSQVGHQLPSHNHLHHHDHDNHHHHLSFTSKQLSQVSHSKPMVSISCHHIIIIIFVIMTIVIITLALHPNSLAK